MLPVLLNITKVKKKTLKQIGAAWLLVLQLELNRCYITCTKKNTLHKLIEIPLIEIPNIICLITSNALTMCVVEST